MTVQPVFVEPLSEQTFHLFRRLIYEKTSINMRDTKQILVSNRLRKRLVALNLTSYDEYYRYLTEGGGRDQELAKFIDAVSTNETYFFREGGHFDALRQWILPELFKRKRRVHIWCAGCSTGEEPFTLRILLAEDQGVRWAGEADIIATDISSEVIEKARRGVYKQHAVRLVPPEMLVRYFTAAPDGSYRLCDEVREGVELRVHNLLRDQPPAGPFDVIFCRNVMIYFDKPTQKRLVDEYFAEALDPQGYLCIGHSESLSGTSERFRYLRALKTPIYQKVREQPR